MLCFGEKVVWEVGLYLLEVISERREGAMVGALEEEIELGAVDLESVDLAMLKFERTDDGSGRLEATRGGSSCPG